MSPSQNTFSKTSHAHGKSVDRREMENFADIADAWWDPNGKFRPLHAMNGCRIRYLKEQICQHFHCDPDTQLKGLCLLDIGCGGGLLTEPMARLGAQVTGIDALEKNVRIAKNHAEEMGLEIEYRFTTAEDMVRTSSGFDVVLIMEVIEHVINPSEFIASCTENVRPGGLIFSPQSTGLSRLSGSRFLVLNMSCAGYLQARTSMKNSSHRGNWAGC